MKQFTIQPNEAGQGALKYISKLLPSASMGLLRKSMRKKNITLNNTKMEGKEKLQAGDVLTVWFSEETLAKFMERDTPQVEISSRWKDFPQWIVYEDDQILVLNKPAGLLSQGDGSGKESLNDGLLSYLHDQVTATVKPSICNRLDRNTSGLVLAGKTVQALQALNGLIKDRSLKKEYQALVLGHMEGSGVLKGFLVKNHQTNQVRYTEKNGPGALPIETRYHVLDTFTKKGISFSRVQVELVTGRSHQIRLHFSSIGHPLLGDRKYGNKESLAASDKLHIRRQMLHAFQITFPMLSGPLENLSGKCFQADLPEDFLDVVHLS